MALFTTFDMTLIVRAQIARIKSTPIPFDFAKSGHDRTVYAQTGNGEVVELTKDQYRLIRATEIASTLANYAESISNAWRNVGNYKSSKWKTKS